MQLPVFSRTVIDGKAVRMECGNSVLGIAEIRRNRGISLEAIAQNTKIGLRFLQAIEAGQFEKLPGGIYDTNYIRQYARSIDFDESALLAQYRQKMGNLQTA